jgi:DNA ligase-1
VKRFVELYVSLDRTNRQSEKIDLLEQYFRTSPPEDAAWALAFLLGRRPPRGVSTTLLRQWAAEETALSPWLVDACYEAVGDLAETLALLLPDAGAGTDLPLHRVVEERILPLRSMDEDGRRALVKETWRLFLRDERFVWHKLITGGFRVGAARGLVERAMARAAGIEPAEMAHRLTGDWLPTAETFRQLLSSDAEADPAKPYPFFLAHPLRSLEEIGEASEWQAEWKWDGIRAQLVRRGRTSALWSRGEELITERFPEVVQASELLPSDCVLDGELICWRGDAPLPFSTLQRRIGRTKPGAKILAECPAALIAYDLLELEGRDVRAMPLEARRALLEELLQPSIPVIRISTRFIDFGGWEALRHLRASARDVPAEGLMLKRRSSPYGVGRRTGDWWKWKVEPYTMDAVLVYAQAGHGRRAGLCTDYTFGVWHQDALLPVAKAYSGLTDAEINELDRWIRRNTTEKHGPVRVVSPCHVFELAFEGIQTSSRHKAGLAVRFPRVLRWRKDKPAHEADTLESLRRLAAGATEEER